jgi:hypothetical protein
MERGNSRLLLPSPSAVDGEGPGVRFAGIPARLVTILKGLKKASGNSLFKDERDRTPGTE